MSAPVKPPQLDPSSTYIHITSPLPPAQIAANASSKQVDLTYIAPVGELKGEYIFQLGISGDAGSSVAGVEKRDEAVRALKGVEGVRGAKVMEQKMRAKR